MSVGFLSFEGRKETSEGLEPPMATRFYSRARAIHQLLPLLNRSDNPHVINVLGGGGEGSLLSEDLGLKKPGNYSVVRAAVHFVTMPTLTLEGYAKQYPGISFVHTHPGIVSTLIFRNGTSRISGFFIRSIVAPLVIMFCATSEEDAGARALFYGTNTRHTVDATTTLAMLIPQGYGRAARSNGGVLLIDHYGESVSNEKVLDAQRSECGELVARHLDNIFS